MVLRNISSLLNAHIFEMPLMFCTEIKDLSFYAQNASRQGIKNLSNQASAPWQSKMDLPESEIYGSLSNKLHQSKI